MNLTGQDKSGKSVVHYVVSPLRYGSYENVALLNLLAREGFNVQLKDGEGKTP